MITTANRSKTRLIETGTVSLLILLFSSIAVAEEAANKKIPDQASKRDDRSELGDKLSQLTYIYQADMAPAEFIRRHACVVGDWEYQSETDSHWIGMLYYVSDNSDPEIRIGAQLQVRKSKAVKVDMKKWKGRILLQKNNPQWTLDGPEGEESDFTVLGYDKRGNFLNGGIINLHKVLPYKPAEQ